MVNDLAYVKGIMDGDGNLDRWNQNRPGHGLGKPRLRLGVTSRAFARSFSEAVTRLGLIPRWYEEDRTSIIDDARVHRTWKNHVYLVRATCPELLVQQLSSLDIQNLELGLDYLKGFFESEGHFCVTKYAERECWQWGVTNKDLTKLEAIKGILAKLGISSTIYGPYEGQHGVSRLLVQRRNDIERLLALGVHKWS